MFFDKESHMKEKVMDSDDSESYMTESSCDISSIHSSSDEDSGIEGFSNPYVKHMEFTRKFLNVDKSTCWLNSCLQLVLSALDYYG